jgi:hypothetical protein
MLTVKEAAQVAGQFVSDLFNAKDVRLEEVELAEDGRTWEVTVSFSRSTTEEPVPPAIYLPPMREFKVVSVFKDDGAVRSVRMRQLV